MEVLAIIGGTVAVLLIAFLKGAQSGSDSAELDLKNKVIDDAAEAKKIAEHVAGMSNSAKREQLRKYAKK